MANAAAEAASLCLPAAFFDSLTVFLWTACAWCLPGRTVARAFVQSIPKARKKTPDAIRRPTSFRDIMTGRFIWRSSRLCRRRAAFMGLLKRLLWLLRRGEEAGCFRHPGRHAICVLAWIVLAI